MSTGAHSSYFINLCWLPHHRWHWYVAAVQVACTLIASGASIDICSICWPWLSVLRIKIRPRFLLCYRRIWILFKVLAATRRAATAMLPPIRLSKDWSTPLLDMIRVAWLQAWHVVSWGVRLGEDPVLPPQRRLRRRTYIIYGVDWNGKHPQQTVIVAETRNDCINN